MSEERWWVRRPGESEQEWANRIEEHNPSERDEVLAVIRRHRAAHRPAQCYSDHNEDIRTKGSCDYCRSTVPDSFVAIAPND